MTEMFGEAVAQVTVLTENLASAVSAWLTAAWFVPLVIALITVLTRRYMHGFIAVFLGMVLGLLGREQAIMTIVLIILGYFATIGYRMLFSSEVSELYTPTLDPRAIERYRKFLERRGRE